MKRGVVAAVAVLKIFVVSAWLLSSWWPVNTVYATPSGAAETGETAKEATATKEVLVPEGEKGLLAAINRRQNELDAREKDVRLREERLGLMKKDIDDKIAELNRVRKDIAAFAERIDAANNERVKKLVKIYEAMNPEEAAPRIEKLETETAVQILTVMTEKKAAKILEFMNVERSAALSQSLKLKRN